MIKIMLPTKKLKVDGANEEMILNISTGQLDDV